MPSKKIHSQVRALFADLEYLASQPQVDETAMLHELKSLRARVSNREAQPLQDQQKGQAALRAQLTPMLYEKEQVGYAYAGDRVEALQSTDITGLDVNQVLLAPLTETGRPIGTVLVEPPAGRSWDSDETELAEAIAQQVSLQIQNLRLLESAERARIEAQAATRRFTHESWEAFLDAIHQSERIGYAYDQNGVELYTEPAPTDVDFQEEVSVLDEQVGKLYLKSSPAAPLTDEDKVVVAAVARQVGQQVENLRLLAEASRARAVAEEATRRLSRESWKAYAERKDDSSLGFIYDSNQVLPLSETPADISLSKELFVRGEPIGRLAVAGLSDISPEAANLLDVIAAQTSIHLEALRLTEELQRRAAELQELDRLKSSFLANMSHELRTPLNSILGFSDVMLEGIDGPLTEYMENDLRLIQKNGQHLLSLINDVLDMAKIESGRLNLLLEKFNVYNMLENVLSITSTLADAKKLALFIEPDSEQDVEIVADNMRINQVMINLVNNSIKFTETGQVSVRVNSLGHDKVLITVKDTGLGIPADQQEKIFQEFSQVDSSTTRKAGGTGLGLPISRRLVEMHGGRIWAESTGVSGEGTTFYVEMLREARIVEDA